MAAVTLGVAEAPKGPTVDSGVWDSEVLGVAEARRGALPARPDANVVSEGRLWLVVVDDR